MMLRKFPTPFVWRPIKAMPLVTVNGSVGTFGWPTNGRKKFEGLCKMAPSPGLSVILGGTHAPSDASNVDWSQLLVAALYFVTMVPSGTLGAISRRVLPPLMN